MESIGDCIRHSLVHFKAEHFLSTVLTWNRFVPTMNGSQMASIDDGVHAFPEVVHAESWRGRQGGQHTKCQCTFSIPMATPYLHHGYTRATQ